MKEEGKAGWKKVYHTRKVKKNKRRKGMEWQCNKDNSEMPPTQYLCTTTTATTSAVAAAKKISTGYLLRGFLPLRKQQQQQQEERNVQETAYKNNTKFCCDI